MTGLGGLVQETNSRLQRKQISDRIVFFPAGLVLAGVEVHKLASWVI